MLLLPLLYVYGTGLLTSLYRGLLLFWHVCSHPQKSGKNRLDPTGGSAATDCRSTTSDDVRTLDVHRRSGHGVPEGVEAKGLLVSADTRLQTRNHQRFTEVDVASSDGAYEALQYGAQRQHDQRRLQGSGGRRHGGEKRGCVHGGHNPSAGAVDLNDNVNRRRRESQTEKQCPTPPGMGFYRHIFRGNVILPEIWKEFYWKIDIWENCFSYLCSILGKWQFSGKIKPMQIENRGMEKFH